MTESSQEESASAVPGFTETPFQDASWEVVGEVDESPEFAPLEIEVLGHNAFRVDPMFRDFGGFPEDDLPQRWHLPQEYAHRGEEAAVRHQREMDELHAEYAEKIALARKEAHEEGRSEGHASAIEESNSRWQTIEAHIREVMADFAQQAIEALEQTQKASLHLTLEIAQKIIGTGVEINPEYIVQIIHEALAQSGAANIQKVRVSQQDLEFIEVVGVRNIIREFDGSWDFEADPSIQAGCVVETSAGEIDFDLNKAWDRVRDNIIRVAR